MSFFKNIIGSNVRKSKADLNKTLESLKDLEREIGSDYKNLGRVDDIKVKKAKLMEAEVNKKKRSLSSERIKTTIDRGIASVPVAGTAYYLYANKKQNENLNKPIS